MYTKSMRFERIGDGTKALHVDAGAEAVTAQLVSISDQWPTRSSCRPHVGAYVYDLGRVANNPLAKTLCPRTLQ